MTIGVYSIYKFYYQIKKILTNKYNYIELKILKKQIICVTFCLLPFYL